MVECEMCKLIFILLVGLTLSSNVYAADYWSDEKCEDLAKKAKTQWAKNEIITDCKAQKKVWFSFQYDLFLKCAIKSGKAKSEIAAREIYINCI
tara:strand:+ start:163 stop:444 length:282 start_codon:yes stop_codon:yes gene_type:complete